MWFVAIFSIGGRESILLIMDVTYEWSVAVRTAPALNFEVMKIQFDKSTKFGWYVRRYNKTGTPRKSYRNNKIVVYCNQAFVTKRIMIVSEDNIEECLSTIMNEANFVGSGLIYGTVGIRFTT